MFDWFWEFLYMLSKTIFRLIDGLILCANKLCGIDPISFDGEETDFMTYLLFSDEIGFAFRVSAILATILLVVFTVFMIIRSIAKEKEDGTPAQIGVKAFKTLLMFFLVPLVMIAFMTIGNVFVKALYAATMQSSATPGAFLFSAFASDGGMAPEYVELFRTGELDYTVTSEVSTYMEIADFPFLFSWLAGGVALFAIGVAMLTFVDRVLSIVILYIAAPVSISTSVIDDGARFKLWRDQFLSKFIMGYGMILAINIYALVCGLVTKPTFAFFADNAFLDLIMKLLLIGGGALTLQKAMALIGNLVSQGAGSNELRDSALSTGKLASIAMAAATGGASLAMKPIKSLAGSALRGGGGRSGKSGSGGSSSSDTLGSALGGSSDKNGVDEALGKSGAQNTEKANYGANQNSAKDAISGNGFKTSDWGMDKKNDNDNNEHRAQKSNGMVNNAINGEKMEKRNANNNEEGDNK